MVYVDEISEQVVAQICTSPPQPIRYPNLFKIRIIKKIYIWWINVCTYEEITLIPDIYIGNQRCIVSFKYLSNIYNKHISFKLKLGSTMLSIHVQQTIHRRGTLD